MRAFLLAMDDKGSLYWMMFDIAKQHSFRAGSLG